MKVLPLLALFLVGANLRAEMSAIGADQLAGKMAAALEDGDSTARVRMKTSAGDVLQVQIKSRRSAGRVVSVYEVLWPAGRKGERAILRRNNDSAAEGEEVSASGQRTKITGERVTGGIFGTDLAFIDAVENFFLWPDQKITGKEKVGKVECVILESRPSGPSPHGKVRSWIDPGRLVVHRVEKYDRSDRLHRTVMTTEIAKDDNGHDVPSGMVVARPAGSYTEIDGSNIRHDVKLTDADFSP